MQNLFKSEFPVSGNVCYLNHASVAPWPKRTYEAVKRFAEENLQYGAKNYPQWLQIEQNLRVQAARLINAPSANDIALLKNTSEALSLVAYGMHWEAGDNVVICEEEFPSNRIVWESLDSQGVAVRKVPVYGQADPEGQLLAACNQYTRILSVSSVQYASGLRLNLNRLGNACHKKGIAFCVDAIQGLGVIPHNVQTMQIDFLAADGHKWLLGPEGLAIFYCRPSWREKLTLRQYGWRMLEDYQNVDRKEWQPAATARRFECGSPNMLGIHALSASLSLLLEVGTTEIEQRVLACTELLMRGISENKNLELITPIQTERYAGIVTFKPKHGLPATLFSYLTSNNVICAQRGGGIRFSPHCYTDPEQLKQVLGLLQKYKFPS